MGVLIVWLVSEPTWFQWVVDGACCRVESTWREEGLSPEGGGDCRRSHGQGEEHRWDGANGDGNGLRI